MSPSYSSDEHRAEYGDVIYVERIAYRHYGVYVSQDIVIHFAGINGDFNNPCIHATDLSGFLSGSKKYYICKFPQNYFNYKGHDKLYRIERMFDNILPAQFIISMISTISYSIDLHFNGLNYKLYSPEETVDRAMSQLNKGNYNLILDNCEHFAMWCKTGLHKSSQVDNVLGGCLIYEFYNTSNQ